MPCAGARWQRPRTIDATLPSTAIVEAVIGCHLVFRAGGLSECFDMRWAHMLILDNYSSGPTAPYKSWVLLEKSPAGEE